ncbi:MAG TPA: adenylate/guanylate cyclase domain-containing protein, partial [Alphaproteobacteria bacterium]|nr:adenylate/guanylate cyclase domain-containing protein [Alphaproteobacteria bacterium]
MPRLFKRSKPRVPGLRRRIRLPIAAVLVVGFGALMLVAVASVLVLGTGIGVSSTYSLLEDKAQLALDNVQVRLRHQLDPVADLADFLAERILAGDLDTVEMEALSNSLELALAATPQVTGLGFVSSERMTGILVTRTDGRFTTISSNVEGNEDIETFLAEARSRRAPHWSDPIWEEDIGASLVTLMRPVFQGGRLLGVIVAGVSLRDL